MRTRESRTELDRGDGSSLVTQDRTSWKGLQEPERVPECPLEAWRQWPRVAEGGAFALRISIGVIDLEAPALGTSVAGKWGVDGHERGHGFTRTQGHVASPGPRGCMASPGPRCAWLHPDPGPSLTRIQGHTASPGPGIQLHPDPGACGLTRTQGHDQMKPLGLLQCLDRTDLGTALLPASDHPPASFPVATFGTISAILCFPDQPTLVSELNSLLPSNQELPDSSELLVFPPGGGPINHLVTLHLQASYTSFSELLFQRRQCGSGGHGPLLLTRSRRGPGEEPEPGPCGPEPGPVCPVFCPHRPSAYDFLRPTSWMSRLLSVSSKDSPSSMTRKFWSPEAFEGPLCLP
ncbi:hypothetical protein QTO34_002827, partial [Cnephaeus nilssonii]